MSASESPLSLWGDDPDRFSLEDLAERAGIHPDRIHIYVEFGLLEPCERAGEQMLFPTTAVLRVRTIERLRRDTGVNLAGVSIILDLVERVRRLQSEVERLRR